MPISNPLTGVDQIIAAQMTGFAALLAEVPAVSIQVWDREVDLRDDPEDQVDVGNRIWLVPISTRCNFGFSNGAAKIEMVYQVGYASGRLTIESMRKIEWLLIRAFGRMYKNIGPDGAALSLGGADPVSIEDVSVGQIDPDREPLDAPQEWRGLFELTVIGYVAHAALVA